MSAPRPDHLGLGYSSHPGAAQGRSGSPNSNGNSPIDSSARSHFGLSGGLNSTAIMSASSRSGAGSPSHELGGSSRLFSKRYVGLLFLQPAARSPAPNSSACPLLPTLLVATKASSPSWLFRGFIDFVAAFVP